MIDLVFIRSTLAVKCPRGMYYDVDSATCKNCPVGNISTEEGSLQCQPCPADSSTLEEGSKTCTGKLSFTLALITLTAFVRAYCLQRNRLTALFLLRGNPSGEFFFPRTTCIVNYLNRSDGGGRGGRKSRTWDLGYPLIANG